MRPLFLGLLLVVVVAGLWIGSSAGVRTAEARPTYVLALDPTIVNSLTEAACAPDCDLTDPADLLAVAEADGDGDGGVEEEDFASVDVDGDQLNADTGVLWIVAFVTNDQNVHFDADEGIFSESGSSEADCPSDFTDEDCDDDGEWSGDSVVAAALTGGGVADEDDAVITVTQSGIDVEIDYAVVGDASGSISGIVVGDEDRPVQGCRMRADPLDEGHRSTAYTNAEGAYMIRYLATADYVVEAWCDGYGYHYFDGKIDSDDADPVHVTDGQNTPNINFNLPSLPTPTLTPVPAQRVIATIHLPFGFSPWAVAVNPLTNRVYVSNPGEDAVSVIDGATNSVTDTIDVGEHPCGLGVNPNTDRIFVANRSDRSVSVIDGKNNDVIASILMEGEPCGVAVNPDTNLVYVDSFHAIWVIDATSNTVAATIPMSSVYPGTVAVNPVTNRVYVGRVHGYGVAIIDGATNERVGGIPLGYWPHFLAVNPYTNRIYAHANSDFPHFFSRLYIIDGDNGSVVEEILDLHTGGVGANPTTDHVFFATVKPSGYVTSVFDEATDTVIANVPVGERPAGIGVNAVTNRIYVANVEDDTITVISDPRDNTPTPTDTPSVTPAMRHRRATATPMATQTVAAGAVVRPAPTVQPPVAAVAPLIALPATGSGSGGDSPLWKIGLALVGLSLALGSGAALVMRRR